MSPVTRTVCVALITVVFGAVGTAQYSQPVRDVENPARTPFWGYGTGTANAGVVNALITVGVVPSGQRLVIEQVGVRCMMATADNISLVAIPATKKQSSSSYSTYSVPIPAQKQGYDAWSGKVSWVASEQMRVYSDGYGQNITINVMRGNAGDTAECYATLFGYTLATP